MHTPRVACPHASSASHHSLSCFCDSFPHCHLTFCTLPSLCSQFFLCLSCLFLLAPSDETKTLTASLQHLSYSSWSFMQCNITIWLRLPPQTIKFTALFGVNFIIGTLSFHGVGGYHGCLSDRRISVSACLPRLQCIMSNMSKYTLIIFLQVFKD